MASSGEQEVISVRAKSFIHAAIDSVELLRVLLLLQRDRNRAWSYEEINGELRSTEGSIRRRVDDLIFKQVLALESIRDERVRFIPFSLEVDELVMVIAGHFQIRPYKIIDLIYSRPNSAIQSFADAFKLKKEEE
ncbi:MAG: hypothetical protein ACXWQO_15570 [Bdellovibrionota bacterium]